VSSTPLKSFYSVGQNEGTWEVCLVDIWDNGRTSMMVIDKFDTQEDAQREGNRLEQELRSR